MLATVRSYSSPRSILSSTRTVFFSSGFGSVPALGTALEAVAGTETWTPTWTAGLVVWGAAWVETWTPVESWTPADTWTPAEEAAAVIPVVEPVAEADTVAGPVFPVDIIAGIMGLGFFSAVFP